MQRPFLDYLTSLFRLLVAAHKRKAAQARVQSLERAEERKKERRLKKEKEEEETASTVTEVITSPSAESRKSIAAEIHKEEVTFSVFKIIPLEHFPFQVLFVKRVFPHTISLSEEDLGLNL